MSITTIKHILSALLLLVFTAAIGASPLDDAAKMIKDRRFDEAQKQLLSIKYKFKDSEWESGAMRMLGKLYEQKRDLDAAILEYSDLSKKFRGTSDAEEAMISIARIKTQQNDRPGAINAYSDYVNMYPKGSLRVTALFNMAGLYKEGKEQLKALNLYDNVIKYHQDETWFVSWSAIYGGHLLRAAGDYDKAVQWYNRVPRNASNEFFMSLADLNAAQTMSEKKDYKMAQEMFKTCLKKHKQFTEEALMGLGNAYTATGELALAKETFESLSVLFPSSQWAKLAETKAKELTEILKKQAK